jgi:hypothetical protein
LVEDPFLNVVSECFQFPARNTEKPTGFHPAISC